MTVRGVARSCEPTTATVAPLLQLAAALPPSLSSSLTLFYTLSTSTPLFCIFLSLSVCLFCLSISILLFSFFPFCLISIFFLSSFYFVLLSPFFFLSLCWLASLGLSVVCWGCCTTSCQRMLLSVFWRGEKAWISGLSPPLSINQAWPPHLCIHTRAKRSLPAKKKNKKWKWI